MNREAARNKIEFTTEFTENTEKINCIFLSVFSVNSVVKWFSSLPHLQRRQRRGHIIAAPKYFIQPGHD
jgi:hypothetical protein